jgi:hypothetical protein
VTVTVPLFGDARAEIVTALTGLLADSTATYTSGVEVSGRLPAGPLDAPRVYVTTDGNPDGIWPANQRVTIRVLCVHTSEADTHDLAQLAWSLLLSNQAAGDHLAAVHELTGPHDDYDPLNPVQPMSWFTVRASMKGRLTTL